MINTLVHDLIRVWELLSSKTVFKVSLCKNTRGQWYEYITIARGVAESKDQSWMTE